jgi:hypothetical protein
MPTPGKVGYPQITCIMQTPGKVGYIQLHEYICGSYLIKNFTILALFVQGTYEDVGVYVVLTETSYVIGLR